MAQYLALAMNSGLPEVEAPLAPDKLRNAEPGEIRLYDPARTPDLIALNGASDDQLVQLLRTDRGSAAYLIAFFDRYRGLVKGLLEPEGSPPGLTQRTWFNAFDVLLHQKRSVTPAAGWLAGVVAQSIVSPDREPVASLLPAPLSWYLYRSLDQMPPVLRITLTQGEVAGYSDLQLAEFFKAYQLSFSTEEVANVRIEARRLFVVGLSTEVRSLYFGDPLDVATPLLALNALGIYLPQEVERFERWSGQQSIQASPVPSAPGTPVPIETELYTADPSPAPSRPQLQPLIGLFCVAVGLGALLTFAFQSGWQPLGNDGQSTAGSPVVSSPEAALSEPPAAIIEPSPLPLEASVPYQPAVSPEVPVTPASPVPQVTQSGELTEPLIEAALQKKRYVTVLVADPAGQNLAKVRRLQSGAFYRKIEGQSFIQFGAFKSRKQLDYALNLLKSAGFTATLSIS